MLFLGFEISGKIREDSSGNWSNGALGSVSHLIRLRTNQNLATELDLAIVAKRSFKNCVYFIYVLLNLNIVKKLQANT